MNRPLLSWPCAFAIALGIPTLMGCSTVGSQTIEDIQAGQRGASFETAIKVSSVKQEYQIIEALGFEPVSQALSVRGRKAYDVITVRNSETGETTKLFFDISGFYGRMW